MAGGNSAGDGSDDDDDDGTSFSEVALGEAPPRPSMAAAAVKTTTTMQDIASLLEATAAPTPHAARPRRARTISAPFKHRVPTINMAALSAYLGHVNPAGTYWYLSASPELMELAAARLEGRLGALR